MSVASFRFSAWGNHYYNGGFMLNKFWMWLLGFKDPSTEDSKSNDKSGGKPAGGSANDTSSEDEGNFRSGPDGYQGGGYEGR